VLDSFGALDAIYANAGVSGGLVPLFEQTVEQWRQILQTNLIGPFLAIKHAGAHMVKEGRGSIVLTAPRSPACGRMPGACRTAPARPAW